MKQATIYDLLPLLKKGWVAICIGCCDCWYKHYSPLTPAEVAELTGYKVEEEV